MPHQFHGQVCAHKVHGEGHGASHGRVHVPRYACRRTQQAEPTTPTETRPRHWLMSTLAPLPPPTSYPPPWHHCVSRQCPPDLVVLTGAGHLSHDNLLGVEVVLYHTNRLDDTRACDPTSASSRLVGFGELNDDTIKNLTSLQNVE